MNTRQKALLRDVVAKRSPEHMKLIDELLSESIDYDGKLFLIELVNDEFLEEGINPDFSPNATGDELESLLDAINRKVFWE